MHLLLTNVLGCCYLESRKGILQGVPRASNNCDWKCRRFPPVSFTVMDEPMISEKEYFHDCSHKHPSVKN